MQLSVSAFRVFGEYGYIPVLVTIKRKAAARAVLAHYLFVIDDTHFQVLLPHNGCLLLYRIANIQPQNKVFDPVTRLREVQPPTEHNKARVNPHHAVPVKAFAAHQHTPVRAARTPQLSPPGRSVPRTLREARVSCEAHHWREVYEKDLRTHVAFGIFRAVPRASLTAGTKALRLLVIFSHKLDREGHVKGYKARLFYPGNQLLPGYHYDPAALSVHAADRDAVRMIFSIAAHKSMTLYHADLKSALLHERYTGSTLYLQTPCTFDGGPAMEGDTVQVMLNIYGIQSALRCYADGLRVHLTSLGYQATQADTNVYVRRTARGTLIMAVTMDDFTVATDSPRMYRQLLSHLCLKYQVKDLGHPSHMLGWCVRQHPITKGIHLASPHLERSFIAAMNMQHARAASTPYVAGLKLHAARNDDVMVDIRAYQRAVGVLRCLVDCTRPDLAVTACDLARALQRPTRRHWKAAEQVARYLIGTTQIGLVFGVGTQNLHTKANAAFSVAHAQRLSVYGFLVYHGPNLVS